MGEVIRRTVLTMAIACPGVGLLAVITHVEGWFTGDSLLYRYQTLLGAGVAIAAAIIAVVPVWRQLASMRLQTGTLHRQFLADHVNGLVNRRKRLLDRIEKFVEPAGRRLYEIEELEGGRVNPHWAFEQEQLADRLADDLSDYLGLRQDPVEVDEQLERVVDAIRVFERRCRDIHFTDSHEQSDEDHDISNEDWKLLIDKGREAERLLPGDLLDLTRAIDELRVAFDRPIDLMRQTLRSLDRELIRARP